MVIAPTILVSTFEEFAKQVAKLKGQFDYAQIDVMDGRFVANKSFTEIEKINKLKAKIKFELHLMVEDPLKEMKKWREVKNIFRVIFHLESKAEPAECVSFARGEGWEVGIALNPDTPLSDVRPFIEKIDVLQFMTVYPGRQGAPFVPKVLDKIREFTKLKPRPPCAVDGAVNKNNIRSLAELGVEIFNVGSYLTRASDPTKAAVELKRALGH